MADRDWPTAPWHLLLVRAKDHLPFDYLVEHSHRAAAWTCGFTVLGLAVGLMGGCAAPFARLARDGGPVGRRRAGGAGRDARPFRRANGRYPQGHPRLFRAGRLHPAGLRGDPDRPPSRRRNPDERLRRALPPRCVRSGGRGDPPGGARRSGAAHAHRPVTAAARAHRVRRGRRRVVAGQDGVRGTVRVAGRSAGQSWSWCVSSRCSWLSASRRGWVSTPARFRPSCSR